MSNYLKLKNQVDRSCINLLMFARKLEKCGLNITPLLMEELDKLFSELDILIKVVSQDTANSLLSDDNLKEMIPTIQWVRAIYEYEMEKQDAFKVLLSSDVDKEINKSISKYFGSSIYDKSFYSALDKTTRTKNSRARCLVVGSGPLPITAIMLDKTHNLKVTCLDVAKESFDISRKIFLGIRTTYSVEHIVADILDWTEFHPYDVIFINGLVGIAKNNHDKNKILDHLEQNIIHDCLIIFRSGYGLNQMFYPEVNSLVRDDFGGKVILPSRLGRSAMILFNLTRRK